MKTTVMAMATAANRRLTIDDNGTTVVAVAAVVDDDEVPLFKKQLPKAELPKLVWIPCCKFTWRQEGVTL